MVQSSQGNRERIVVFLNQTMLENLLIVHERRLVTSGRRLLVTDGQRPLKTRSALCQQLLQSHRRQRWKVGHLECN